jgi:hypothetical protein
MVPHIQTEGRPVPHLLLRRWAMDELGIPSVIEEHCSKHALARVSDAECAVALGLNILSGRLALYAMDGWLSHTDAELLVGEGCMPDAFNDTRLALALDHLDEVGTDVIMGGIVERYLAWGNRLSPTGTRGPSGPTSSSCSSV